MQRLTLLLALVFVSCAHLPPGRPESVVSDRLLCGRSIPGGGEVTDADLTRFLEEVVTVRFPEGFSVFQGQGHWRGGNEEMFVIEIIHPVNEAADRKVAEIAEEYRVRFRQQAVLRVIAPAWEVLIERTAAAAAGLQR